jgi:condensin complex subunit 3
MISLLLYTLENEESEDVQAVLCVGLCKLLLSGFVMDSRVCKAFYYLSTSPGLTTIFFIHRS